MRNNILTSSPSTSAIQLNISANNTNNILINTTQKNSSMTISTNKNTNISTMDSHSGYVTNYNDLRNKPSINGVLLQGNKTGEDLGLSPDKNYYHIQNEASSEWVIQHNLNKYPSITVVDSAGNEVLGEIFYNNINMVTIKFKGSFKGSATLN